MGEGGWLLERGECDWMHVAGHYIGKQHLATTMDGYYENSRCIAVVAVAVGVAVAAVPVILLGGIAIPALIIGGSIIAAARDRND